MYPDLHHSAHECGKTLKIMLYLIILYFLDVKNKRDFFRIILELLLDVKPSLKVKIYFH